MERSRKKPTKPFRCYLNQIPYDYTLEVMNRFKGLDLVDKSAQRIMNGSYIAQEAVTKTIPKKKKCRKAKWLSDEVSQIAEERREVKSKGERERYIQLNAEFQRIARRDKKALLNEQRK